VFAQIAQFLIETVAGFFVFALLARFHFQWLRVPFRNPLGEFVVTVSNWLVLPARRVIPPLRQIDPASLVVAWLVQLAGLWTVYAVHGHDFAASPGAAGLGALALVDLLRYSLYLLIAAVIVQAVLSWVNPYTPLAPVFDALARPFLRPIRRVLPHVANIDLSPLVLLVILQVLLIPVAYARGLVAAML
jgi:YggT family protein